MDVRELAAAIERGDALVVVDVREHDEVAHAPFPGALHVPLAELEARAAEIPADRTVAVLCHHGMRSSLAVGWLLARGRADVVNVHGGIDAWSRLVDPAVPRY